MKNLLLLLILANILYLMWGMFGRDEAEPGLGGAGGGGVREQRVGDRSDLVRQAALLDEAEQQENHTAHHACMRNPDSRRCVRYGVR